RTAAEHHFGADRRILRYEQVDLGWLAFALEGPAVEDPQTRPVGCGHAIDEILAGENLSRLRERGEPGREVDGVAKDIAMGVDHRSHRQAAMDGQLTGR